MKQSYSPFAIFSTPPHPTPHHHLSSITDHLSFSPSPIFLILTHFYSPTRPVTHDPCRKPSYFLFDIRCVKQCSLFNGFLCLLFSVSRLYDMEVRGSRPSSSASSNQMNHGELVSKQPGYFLVPLVFSLQRSSTRFSEKDHKKKFKTSLNVYYANAKTFLRVFWHW